MFKQFALLAGLLVIVLTFVNPASVVAQCEDHAYREGFFVGRHVCSRFGCTRVNLTAEKVVDGDWRGTQLEVEIRKNVTSGDGRTYSLLIDETVTIPGDPDNLDVSCDLGWAGLHTEVYVNKTITTNGVVTHEYSPIQIHLDLFGFSDYTYDEASYYFIRTARVQGTVDDIPFPNSINGKIRSTQYGGW